MGIRFGYQGFIEKYALCALRANINPQDSVYNADVRQYPFDPEAAANLLEEAGVATIAGTSFGKYGEGYLRLSYANSVENIRAAIGRIGEWLAAQPGK